MVGNALARRESIEKLTPTESLRTRLEHNQGYNIALDRVADILRDINRNTDNITSHDRPECQQRICEELPLHQSQQSSQNHQPTPLAVPDQSFQLQVDVEDRILQRLNQNIIMEALSFDMRVSLDLYFTTSRWIVLLIWLQCFQLLSVVTALMITLLNPNGYTPTSYKMVNMSIIAFGFQPLSCFGGIIIGLYIDDRSFSMTLLSLLSLIPLALLMYNGIMAPLVPRNILALNAAASLISLIVILFVWGSVVRIWRWLLRMLRH